MKAINWIVSQKIKSKHSIILTTFCFLGLFTVGLRYILFRDFPYSAPSNPGDPRLNYLIMQWGVEWFEKLLNFEWTDPFEYPILFPDKHALARSVNHFGSLPLNYLLNFFSNDWFVRGNLWYVSVFALNFWCCWWCVEKFWRQTTNTLSEKKISLINVLVPIICAGLFAFSYPRYEHGSHFQMLPHFATPFIFYFFWKLVNQEKAWIKPAILVGFFSAFQAYLDIHLFLMTVLVFLLSLPLILFLPLRKKIASVLLKGGCAAVVCLILLLPIAEPYYSKSKEVGPRPISEATLYSPKFKDFFRANHGRNKLYRKIFSAQKHHEQTGFLGLIHYPAILLLIAMLFLLIKKKQYKLVLMGGVPLVCYVLFVHLDNVVGKSIFHLVPGFNSIRTPGRFSIMLPPLLFLMLVLGQRKLQQKMLMGLTVLIFGVGVIADAGFNQEDSWKKGYPTREVSLLSEEKEGPVLFLPYYSNAYRVLDYMETAAILDIALVNGHSGSTPENHLPLIEMTKDSKVELSELKKISDLGVKTLVIDTAYFKTSNILPAKKEIESLNLDLKILTL